MYPEIIQKIHNEFFNCDNGTEKDKRLFELGFINAQGTEKYSSKAVYYQKKYPLYKFITKKQVTAICKKYGLIFGKIALFNGFVPEKNLKEIECFKIEWIDCSVFYNEWDIKFEFNQLPDKIKKKFIAHENEFNKITTREISENEFTGKKYNMMIVAPKEQFNLPDDYKIDWKTKKIINMDPIVLQKVNGGYLVITAWGNEASDENVINPINN